MNLPPRHMAALSIGVDSFCAVKGGRTVDVWIATPDGQAWESKYVIKRKAEDPFTIRKGRKR